MRSRSLLWRLGLPLLAAQALVLAVTLWLAHDRVITRLSEARLSALQSVAAPLREEIARAWPDREAARGLCEAASEASGFRIELLPPESRVRAASEGGRAAASLTQTAGSPARAPLLGRVSQASSGDTVWTTPIPGQDEGETPLLRLTAPIEPDRQRAWTFGAIGVVGIAVSVTLGLALLTTLSFSLRGRVSRMSRAADRFAEGQFARRVPLESSSELAPLARAMNRMAQRLHGEVATLLSQRKEREAILRSMNAGVIALDLEQNVLHLNHAAERMLGVTTERARGRLLQEAARQPDLHKFVAEAIDDPDATTSEFELQTDRTMVVHATSSALRDDDGDPAGLLIFLTDVTELRRLESIRTDFAANVSHELRTPITNIKGYAETLMEGGSLDPEHTGKFVGIIHRNAERLGSIVEDMLTLTKLERLDGEDSLPTSMTRIAEVLDNVRHQYGAEADAKRIQLRVEAPADLRADINARLIEQCVGNFVSNAVKYSPPETGVLISARASDESSDRGLIIAVADEGPGISPEHRSRLFERFYRIDKARSREQGGTGLGLAIAKHIAIVHGGRIDIDSAVGRGSTFSLVLPKAARSRS